MVKRHKVVFITVAFVIFLSLTPFIGKSLYFHHQRKRIETAKNFITDFQQTIPALRPLERYNMSEGIAKCGWSERGFVYSYDCEVKKHYTLRIDKNIVSQLHSELLQQDWLTGQEGEKAGEFITTRYFNYLKNDCYVSFGYRQNTDKIELVIERGDLHRIQILDKAGSPISQFELEDLDKTEISDIDVSLRCNWGIL